MEKIYRVLQFRQEKLIAPYVQWNTELQKKVTTKLEQDFSKQVINNAFGKLYKSKTKWPIVDTARNPEELQNLTTNKMI